MTRSFSDLDFLADAIEMLRLHRQLSPEEKAEFMKIMEAEADRCAKARTRSPLSKSTKSVDYALPKPWTRH